jgi:peptidoglycan biosynthesis protein MviN/MurJ (putative lipid II flippase)
LQFHTSAMNSVAMVATFFLALPLGLIGMAQAYLVTATITSVLLVWLICRKLQLPYRVLGTGLLPALSATVLGLALVWLVTGFDVVTLDQWLRATASYLIGVSAAYAAFRRIVKADLVTLIGERRAQVEV